MTELVILVGFQASGKSTYRKEYFDNSAMSYAIVSKDLMSGNKVKQQQRLLEQYLGAGKNVVLDNTSCSIEERALAIKVGKAHGARIICYWFDTPFEECLERNSKREGKAKVPAVAMYTARKRFVEPSFSEGFDAIFPILPKPKVIVNAPKPVKLAVPSKSRAAIFLDKDGVLVDDSDYPYVIPKTTLMPGVEEALIKLAKTKLPIVVISNQAWVAKGRLTMAEAEAVFAELKQKVTAFGGRIDATYFCPHQPKDKCACRKPEIGMLKQAAKDLNIDLKASTFIGDMETDVQCGQKAELARTVLVNNEEVNDCKPSYKFKTLLEATNVLYCA